jgi:hypothetical protein
MTGATDDPGRPLLQIVRGEPSPEQLAALLAVVAARTSAAAAPAAATSAALRPRSLWAAPVLRGPLFPGPGAWCASALPR